MKVGIQVVGESQLRRKLRSRILKQPYIVVAVGYEGVFYALWVHEILSAHHPHGKAKYLTDPAHEIRPLVPKILRKAMRFGGSFANGIMQVARRIEYQSVLEVPVDTGFLKSSSFVEREV